MKPDATASRDFSAQIAHEIREAIIDGSLRVDERLPSETELSDRFGVSRSTVREALKRLAAQNLIRTQRGASGGAFVNRLTFEDAYGQQITTSTLLLSMNDVDFETACEARFTLERACAGLSAERRTESHLQIMQKEIDRQSDPALDDEGFCASDVAFHRALVDAAGNPVLSYQLAGAVEAMQPLMNMITFTARSREVIINVHGSILVAMESRDAAALDTCLHDLFKYTNSLGRLMQAERAQRKANTTRPEWSTR